MEEQSKTTCGKCGAACAAGARFCNTCGEKLDEGMGFVQIYRMGSPLGMAIGYGIYINGQPYGHLANKKSVRIPLSYGTYTFHFTCGMTRRCDDVTVTLSPSNPHVYLKARIQMGFWSNKIVPALCPADQMPPLEE